MVRGELLKATLCGALVGVVVVVRVGRPPEVGFLGSGVVVVEGGGEEGGA
jgi:hypothetical protein